MCTLCAVRYWEGVTRRSSRSVCLHLWVINITDITHTYTCTRLMPSGTPVLKCISHTPGEQTVVGKEPVPGSDLANFYSQTSSSWGIVTTGISHGRNRSQKFITKLIFSKGRVHCSRCSHPPSVSTWLGLLCNMVSMAFSTPLKKSDNWS